MRFSNFFIPTFRENPSEAKIISHTLMLKSGLIKQETSGIYTWMPIGYRVLKKIIKIIEQEHENIGINQILMPTIQSSDIWKISDRYETYGKEMLRINDRNEKELLYGPTNEELMTSVGKHFIKSHKNLPLNFFHIQAKFRDEIRPRFGVMRAREFLMKDAYSFDKNEIQGEKTYEIFFNLYLKIFKKMGISVVPVRAPSGEIGGNLSHEFHFLVESGESLIYIDEFILKEIFASNNIDKIKNIKSFTSDLIKNSDDKKLYKSYKSIELGHIFSFGTKYSKSFNFSVDQEGTKFFPFMGSYGIGISRIPAAIIEKFNDEKGIIWPKEISPFEVILLNLIPKNADVNNLCEKLYQNLKKSNIDIIYDDRSERPGIKFSDADLIGIPIQIIVGKNYVNDKKIGIKIRKTNEEQLVELDELYNILPEKIKNV